MTHQFKLKTLPYSQESAQHSINERLNFLIGALKMSARAFSAAIGVPDSNTRNYLSKNTKLNSDYLEKIASHFSHVNLSWLITGDGEPFLSPPTENTLSPNATVAKNKNFSHSQVIGNNTGTATQHQLPLTAESPSEVAMLQALVEQLRSQLADKERTIQLLLKQNS